jgi:diacylglycerol kinase family enzyme
MKHYILHNPFAGTGNKPTALIETLEASGKAVEYLDITSITDYASFFAGLREDDAVILCGGDGTINRFVNDTEGLTIPCEILYAPGGTGNDFLRDLNREASSEPFSLLPYIQNLPIVEIKGKRYRFLNNVGFGIDGYCCEVGDAKKQSHPDKPVNYTAIAIKGLLFHYKPTTATVIVDGKEYTYKKAWLAPAMKGRYYGGGMNATPDQDRMDPSGKLSVMLFYGKGRLSTLMAFPSIFKGEHIKHTKMVAIHEGNDVRVIFDSPRAVQIDGETVLGVTEYHAYSAPKTENENTLPAEAISQA